MSGLTDRVVVVTGAGGSAGPPAVRALTDAGAHVIAVDREVALVAPLAGERVSPAVVNLFDRGETLAWAQELIGRYGRVDGLVHLVGGWRGGEDIVDADPTDWPVLQALLVETLVNAATGLHDAIKASDDGRLMIISATAVANPTAKNAAYAAAKAAAETWVRACGQGWKDTQAAAVPLRIKALLTDAMREAKPEAKFAGFTHVDDLAQQIVALWDEPAADLNGRVRDLT